LPGRPITGVAADAAPDLGHAGPHRDPGGGDLAERADHVGDEVPGAGARPARAEHEVRVAEVRVEGVHQRLAVIGDDAGGERHPARRPDHGGQHRAVGVADLPGARLVLGGHELVTAGEHDHPWWRDAAHARGRPGDGQQRDVRWD
jgi:hypothetical protein